MDSLVSIIIPTYNRMHTIERAVDSALSQTYKSIEIIIVDDASTDNTEEIIKRFRDNRIIFLKHENNKNASAARNTGIRLAKGEYIALLDSDDVWLQNKLEKQVEMLAKLDKTWGAIYCGFFYMLKNGNRKFVEATKKGDLLRELFLKELDIGASSTLLFRKEIFENIGLFDESFERHQDWEFLVRFFRKYKLAKSEEPLVQIYGPNMPSGEKTRKIKEKFLFTFKVDIAQFDATTIKQIYARNWLEVASAFAKEGDLFAMIKNAYKSVQYSVQPVRKYYALLDTFFRSLLKKVIHYEK